jgi:hypothetical protein
MLNFENENPVDESILDRAVVISERLESVAYFEQPEEFKLSEAEENQ